MLHCYTWNLCLRYDYICCSRMKARHLPFSCGFNDNETLASYANGIYDYYDVERIEEFVAFKGAYEIESLFEKCENYDDAVYRPKTYASRLFVYGSKEDLIPYNAMVRFYLNELS